MKECEHKWKHIKAKNVTVRAVFTGEKIEATQILEGCTRCYEFRSRRITGSFANEINADIDARYKECER